MLRFKICSIYFLINLRFLVLLFLKDLHKTLILANVRKGENDTITVEELALATEHAPFRHRNTISEVGAQRKKAKVEKQPGENGGLPS